MEARNQRRAGENQKTLPINEDMWFDILLTLTVKDLLRLKTVCKSFYSLVSSPLFRKVHLSQAYTSSRCMVVSRGNKPDLIFLDTLQSDTRSRRVLQVDAHYTVRGPDNLVVLGSCNGVLFIRSHIELYLWNPSTGDNQNITTREFLCNYSHYDKCCLAGIGYDAINDDWKAVVCKLVSSSSFRMEVGLYTSKTRSWKLLNDVYFGRASELSAATVNGNLHWIVHLHPFRHPLHPRRHEKSIVYFDCLTEEFNELERPNWSRCDCSIYLRVLKGKLSLICPNMGESERVFEIWEMREYGVKDSWIKLSNVCDLGMEPEFWIYNNENDGMMMNRYAYNNENIHMVKTYVETLLFPR